MGNDRMKALLFLYEGFRGKIFPQTARRADISLEWKSEQRQNVRC